MIIELGTYVLVRCVVVCIRMGLIKTKRKIGMKINKYNGNYVAALALQNS